MCTEPAQIFDFVFTVISLSDSGLNCCSLFVHFWDSKIIYPCFITCKELIWLFFHQHFMYTSKQNLCNFSPLGCSSLWPGGGVPTVYKQLTIISVLSEFREHYLIKCPVMHLSEKQTKKKQTSKHIAHVLYYPGFYSTDFPWRHCGFGTIYT